MLSRRACGGGEGERAGRVVQEVGEMGLERIEDLVEVVKRCW